MKRRLIVAGVALFAAHTVSAQQVPVSAELTVGPVVSVSSAFEGDGGSIMGALYVSGAGWHGLFVGLAAGAWTDGFGDKCGIRPGQPGCFVFPDAGGVALEGGLRRSILPRIAVRAQASVGTYGGEELGNGPALGLSLGAAVDARLVWKLGVVGAGRRLLIPNANGKRLGMTILSVGLRLGQ